MQAPIEINAKNPYNPEDYFSYNIAAGVIRAPDGARVVTVPDSLLRAIHASLEHEAGEAASVILQQCGKIWGRRFADRHLLEIRREFKSDAGQFPFGLFAQVLRAVWSMNGWGSLSMSFALQTQGFIEVTVENALYGELVGKSDRPVEHLWAGLLGAFFSVVAGQDLEATQVACVSCGAPSNVFLIGLAARAQIVSGWVRQGRSAAKITQSILEGDLA